MIKCIISPLFFKALFCLLIAVPFLLGVANASQELGRVLVFSKTAGYRHSAIEVGIEAIQKLAAENKFAVDTTTNSALFTLDNLKKYSAVIFLNTSGTLLNEEQKKNFERYVQAGGGFVGVHGAAASEYEWKWYGRLLGGFFTTHPKIQEAELNVIDKKHPSTAHLPGHWIHTDEWYNFTKLPPTVHVLITINEDSYVGGDYGKGHPIAWYHNFEGGRSFYTALGHREENYSDPLFLKHLLGGIQYAMANDKAN